MKPKAKVCAKCGKKIAMVRALFGEWVDDGDSYVDTDGKAHIYHPKCAPEWLKDN